MTRKIVRFSLSAAVVVAAVLTARVAVRAQVFETEALGQEVLWSDFFGVDSRALGMGNTGIALGSDGSALVYNPANLARIKRIELRGGLSHLRLSNDTRYGIDGPDLSDGRSMSRTRINALSVTVPVPTYRGSLVVAFGLHRINSFDRAFGVTYAATGNPDFADRGRELETGGVWKWSGGAAVDISPRLSTGLSLHLLTGGDDYRWHRDDLTLDDPVSEDQTINISYVGVAATGGISYALSKDVTAGLTIETPTWIAADEKSSYEVDTASSAFTWVDDATSSYSITRPFVFGLGLAGTFDRFNLAADMRYTDWTQMGFSYDSPDLDAAENATLRFIQDDLKEVVSLQLGGEYLFPEQGLSLRAGYFRDPLPVDSKFIEKERQYFTAGIGLLIDRIMTLDVAYVHGGYKLRDTDPGTYTADYKTRRVYATFGYRI